MTDTNNAAINALDGLAQAMLASVQPLIDARIEQEIEAQKAKIGVRTIRIERNGDETKITGHVHPAFDKVLKLVCAGQNVLLKGPAGCGKTHLASQVAKALKKAFASVGGSGGVSESELTGWLLPTGDGGRFEYHPAPFVTIYETGGIFLLDEVDGFDPNVLLTINQATANGGFFAAKRGASGGSPFVKRHAETGIIAACNTWGNGAGSMYSGRNALDTAFLDRFYPIEMDYDRAYETQLAPDNVCQWVWNIRERSQAANLRREVSTRMIQKMALAIEAGIPLAETKADMLASWSKDERAKIGE